MNSLLFAAALPEGKTWMKVDYTEIAEPQQSSSVDARAMLEQLRAVSPNARLVGSERIRGARTDHYAATIDPQLQAEQLRAAGDALGADVVESQGGAAAVEVWIDRDGYVRRTAMTIPFELVGGEGSSMQMTMDFYAFGIEPEIAVPSEDEVFDATELSQQALEGALEGS